MNRAALHTRDVACMEVMQALHFLSVDVAAGIGLMSDDRIAADPADVAYFVARTAVSELICLGVPVNGLAIATSLPQDRRQPVEAGILELLASLDADPQLVWSHENYLDVHQTAIAVTATGWQYPHRVVCQSPAAGTHAFLYGPGYVRQNIRRSDDDLPNLASLRHYLQTAERVLQVIPIGSRGIEHDISKLCESSGLRFRGSEAENMTRGGPGLGFLILAACHPELPQCRLLGAFTSD
jgi:hypothetical protein